MVQEVKVQSSNFAAEDGTGGMNISGVTKSGTSKFHGSAVRLLARLPVRGQQSVEQHRGDGEAQEQLSLPGGNVGGPITFGDSYTKNRDRLFFFVAYEGQRQQVDSGSHFTRTYTRRDEERRLQRAARQPGVEPEQHPAAAHPAGLPERGAAGAEQRHAADMSATGRYFASLYPRRTTSTREPLQLRLQPARTDQPLRFQGPRRLDHQQQHPRLRPHRQRGRDGREPRGVWWAPADVVALPTPTSGRTAAGPMRATSSRC